MNSESSARPGLGWLGSFLLAPAFAELATALRLMYWGAIVQLLSATAFFCGSLLAFRGFWPPGLFVVVPLGLVGMTVGSFLLACGEHKCLFLSLPMGMTRSLPGHGWLRAAYWTLVGSFLVGLARVAANLGPMRIAASLLQTASFVCLLLFLRRMATVIDRHDLRRFVDWIFGLGGIVIAACALVVTVKTLDLRVSPYVVLATLAAIAVLGFAIALCYVVLLRQMGTAARDFAQFLATEAAVEDEVGATPAAAALGE